MFLCITILAAACLAAAVHENDWNVETITKTLSQTGDNMKGTEEQIRCVSFVICHSTLKLIEALLMCTNNLCFYELEMVCFKCI